MISVIICTYKRADTLRETLRHLAAQVVPERFEWEVLLVDNNSPDHTPKVCEEFIKNSPMPSRYILESQQALSFARNRGIQETTGDIVVFLDDDVAIDPHWIVKLAVAFDNPKCAAAGGKVLAVWPGEAPAWFEERGPFATPNAISHFDLGDETRS